MRAPLVVSTLLAFALAIPTGACRQIADIDDSPTYDGPSPPPPAECGGFRYSNAKCGECGTANCCEVSAQCVGEVECAALVACEQACSTYDDQCLQLCELARPAAVERARAFGACLEDMCAATCIRHPWACLQDLVTPVAGTGPPITVTTRFYDAESGSPVPGLELRACRSSDISCATPLVQAVVTDAEGRAVLPLPTSFFDGYIELTDESGVYPPSLFNFWPPLSEDLVFPLTFTKRETLAKVVAPIATQRADLASVVVQVQDCIGNFPVGVQVSIAPADGSTPFYNDERGIPSKTATQTSEYGTFEVLNVLPNTGITVRATVLENSLAFPPVNVYTRAGAYTVLSLRAPR